MTVDLERLSKLVEIPTREAMVRSPYSQYPSLTDQIYRQRQDIEALRAGLREAIVEIEKLTEQRRLLLTDRFANEEGYQ